MIILFGCILNEKKKILRALTSIYGIGLSLSKKILTNLNIKFDLNLINISEIQWLNIKKYIIENKILVEDALKRKIYLNIKQLEEFRNYRGQRHLRKLPVRGQRTKTNSRTARKMGYLKKEFKNEK